MTTQDAPLDRAWVLDATFYRGEDGPLTFCPYDEATGDVITGLAYLSDAAPGRLVGIFHEDGQEAVEAFCAANEPLLERLGLREAPR